MKTDLVSVTAKGIQTKNAKAPAGTASKQVTGTRIALTKEATEEEHQAVTEVDENPPPDKGTSQNKEETPLNLRKTKADD